MSETDESAMRQIELEHTAPRTAVDLGNGAGHFARLAESYGVLARLTAEQDAIAERIRSLRQEIAKTQQHIMLYYLIDDKGRPVRPWDVIAEEA